MQSVVIFVVALITFKLTFALTLHSNKNDVDYNSYKFDYGVEDHHTGDIKSHQEIKIGKEVSGVYTLREADGTTRVVKYTASPHKGFNAVVQKLGYPEHGINYYQTSKSESGSFDSHSGLALGTQKGISRLYEGLESVGGIGAIGVLTGNTFIGAPQYDYMP